MAIWVEKTVGSILCMVGESIAGMVARGVDGGGEMLTLKQTEGEKKLNKRRWGSYWNTYGLHNTGGFLPPAALVLLNSLNRHFIPQATIV